MNNFHIVFSRQKRAFSTNGNVEDSLPTDSLAFSTIELSLARLSFSFKNVSKRIAIAAFLRVMLCVTNAVDFTTLYAYKITVADTI